MTCDNPAPVTRSSTLPEDSAARKAVPLFSGPFRYFPAALAGIARICKLGNDKHNPGQPMHHARGKSNDHGDCVLRHLMDMDVGDGRDADGTPHVDMMAWRACALSQEWHEKNSGAPFAPGARAADSPVEARSTDRPALIAAAVVYSPDGYVLLGRRIDTKRPALHDKWELPGGHVEAGEQPGEAAVRELHEELGIVAVPRELLFIHPVSTTWADGTVRHYMVMFFRCELVGGTVTLDGESHSEARWVGPAALTMFDMVPSTEVFFRSPVGRSVPCAR